MLQRFVRIQLAIFVVLSVIGLAVMIFGYMQATTWLGIGKMTVTLELPDTGGLYRFSNVTYRGVQVGRVTDVVPTASGAKATLELNTSPKIPADLQAQVRSISAVGEQYVDLRPRNDSAPYLRDGSVIPVDSATIPHQVGPMLDQLSALITSIPKNKLSDLQDELFKGFNGSGYDLGSLFDSASTITADSNTTVDHTRALVDDTVPLLDAQAQTTDATREWARNLAGVTDQITINDPQIRTLLRDGPGSAQEVSRLLEQVKPTLPVLLANLTTLGQVGVTYNRSLEQLMVLLPPLTAAAQALAPWNNPTGLAFGDFRLEAADPPSCTAGFLPPSQWRSPADTTTVDTPDGLYCKLPQDSPIGVRGVRNFPCMGVPGKRAPTVDICDSDKPFEPIAQRQHILGPYPFDPNLAAQGVPPDDRVTFGDNIFAPIEGTPLPPPQGTPAPAGPPPSGGVPPPGPSPDGTAPGVPIAVAQYDPATGRYVGDDGRTYQQSDVAGKVPTTWQDLVMGNR